jgi:hypothetical protein
LDTKEPTVENVLVPPAIEVNVDVHIPEAGCQKKNAQSWSLADTLSAWLVVTEVVTEVRTEEPSTTVMPPGLIV